MGEREKGKGRALLRKATAYFVGDSYFSGMTALTA